MSKVEEKLQKLGMSLPQPPAKGACTLRQSALAAVCSIFPAAGLLWTVRLSRESWERVLPWNRAMITPETACSMCWQY